MSEGKIVRKVIIKLQSINEKKNGKKKMNVNLKKPDKID